MATSETSLDVLSQAAALVNTSTSAMTVIYDSKGSRMSPAKDLPTKGQKVKRSRSRRSLPGGGNPTLDKMKERNNISPNSSPTSSSEPKPESEILSFAYIFPKSQEFANQQSTNYPPPPPYPSPPKNITSFGNSYREPFYKSNSLNNEISSADEDEPLDMSKKCVDGTGIQQHRPSVITCASALRRTQCQHKESEEHNPKCPESVLKMSSENDSSDESKDAKPGHRREITSGMCDPVIDEHFRRSLGKDYSEIFSSTTNNSVSVTVDDHFAKALGDTWLRLQQPAAKDRNPVTSNSNSRSPRPVKHVITL